MLLKLKVGEKENEHMGRGRVKASENILKSVDCRCCCHQSVVRVGVLEGVSWKYGR